MPEPMPAYEPKDFWQERLSASFDLRGTGHPRLSLDYNLKCYRLRAEVLDATLSAHGIALDGRSVLDAGCGTGFFIQHYLSRGAKVSGVDLTEVSVSELARRFPEARFEVGDLSSWKPDRRYDLVSCFDVLFHIVDDRAWGLALDHLASAIEPGGHFVFTEQFPRKLGALASHNVSRGWQAYRPALQNRGLRVIEERPTHHLLNRELGPLRLLNRFPGALFAIDRALLSRRLLEADGQNRLILTRKER